MEKEVINFLQLIWGKKEEVSIVGTLLAGLFKLLPRIRSFFKVRTDLHPFYSWKEVKSATQHFIESKGERESNSANSSPRPYTLIHYFISKAFQINNDQRFYLVLAEGGMGKTTFLINLYLRYNNKLIGKKFKIDLMPLWHPKTWERLVEYPEETARETILLLDSLDEDPSAIANINVRLTEIIDKVWGFRKVVIACSPQLFPDEASEPSEIRIPYAGSSSGFHSFTKIRLAPFGRKDIINYINKRFSIFRLGKRKAAVALIRKSSSLMERPLLLSFLDDLLLTKKRYVYAYEVYDSLIEKWITREANFMPSAVLKAQLKQQLEVICKDLAFALFQKYSRTNGIYLSEAELVALIQSRNYGIDISSFRTKSLISRNQSGLFKFSHFSLFEYFLAQIAIDDAYHIREADLTEFKNALIFYQELFLNKRVLPFFNEAKGHVFTRMNNKQVDIIEVLQSGDFEHVDNLFIQGLKSISMLLISPLKNILTLQAIDTPILSYDGIAKLKKLTTLNFDNCSVSDIKPLAFLSNLTALHLRNGNIMDISPLEELMNIEYLNLENNRVVDLSPLRNLKKLRRLSLVSNKVSSLKPLYGLDNLRHLFIANNYLEPQEIDSLQLALPGCSVNSIASNTYV